MKTSKYLLIGNSAFEDARVDTGRTKRDNVLGLIPKDRIESKIFIIRGKRVMLDRDLAELYGVRTIALRQQVRRNIDRFPGDFMFRLTAGEAAGMVSQNVIPSIQSLGGYLPYAFTEQEE